jgi:benzil reductase ((S)-benzoin forming)
VFSVAPGIIDTPMQDQIRKVSPNDFSEVAGFLEMKKNHVLHDPEIPAKKILDIVQSPENYKNCVFGF